MRAFLPAAWAALAVAAVTSLSAQTDTFPVDDLRPGMVGTGRTVFEGDRLEEFASHYAPENRVSVVLHALYLVQDQQGHITNNAVRHVAQVIGCTTADVEDVVSYYVMFHQQPVGKFVLQVCTTLSCALAGAERVFEIVDEAEEIQIGRAHV